MSNFVLCGAMKLGTGFSPIVCDPKTGELIFCDDVNGNCVMSNLSAMNPFNDIVFDECVQHSIKSGVDGVVFTHEYCIHFKGFVAQYYSYVNLGNIDHEIEFDLNVEYDGEIDLDIEN